MYYALPSRLNKNDSADSNENGDELPIEIRHLEDNDEMLFIPPLFDILTNNLNYNEGQLCKSRSLNDISVPGFSPKEKRRMRDQVRSIYILHNLISIYVISVDPSLYYIQSPSYRIILISGTLCNL